MAEDVICLLDYLDGRQGTEYRWHKFRWNDSARSMI